MEKMKYYPYLDTLKGIAILLMVIGACNSMDIRRSGFFTLLAL